MIKKYVSAGIRAPSGDNCQPWGFRIEGDNKILIHIIPERAKSFFDYKLCGTYLSVGAVIENIRTLAISEGNKIQVTYLTGTDRNSPIASLEIIPGKKQNISFKNKAEALMTRTVNRRPFLTKKIPPGIQNKLLDNPISDIKTDIFHGFNDRARWAKIIYIADLIRFTHKEIHEELFSKILFDSEEVAIKRLGLEYDRLGLGPASALMLKYLQPWDRMKRLIKYGVHRILANQTRFLALASGAIVLITFKDDTVENWIKCGEQTQRFWITAAELSLCIQPMTVALYMNQRYKDEGLKHFYPEQEKLLEEMSIKLAEKIPADSCGGMLFRIGYGWQMKAPAVRQSAEEFML